MTLYAPTAERSIPKFDLGKTTLEMKIELVRGNKTITYIMYDNNTQEKIASMSVLYFNGEHILGEPAEIFVEEPYRRQGIGTYLVAQALSSFEGEETIYYTNAADNDIDYKPGDFSPVEQIMGKLGIKINEEKPRIKGEPTKYYLQSGHAQKAQAYLAEIGQVQTPI